MHELGICDALLKMVADVAKQEGTTEVASVTTLSGVIPRFLEDCWQAVIDGTEFANTAMIVETLEGEAQCLDCGETFTADFNDLRCPKCSGTKLNPISGRELTLKEILLAE